MAQVQTEMDRFPNPKAKWADFGDWQMMKSWVFSKPRGILDQVGQDQKVTPISDHHDRPRKRVLRPVLTIRRLFVHGKGDPLLGLKFCGWWIYTHRRVPLRTSFPDI